MPPGLLPLGSLKGEPGLFAELPGVVSPRSWQDWLGGPGGPGGLSARAGPASPSEKQAVIRAMNKDLRMTFLLSGGAPAVRRGFGARDTLPLHSTNRRRPVQRYTDIFGGHCEPTREPPGRTRAGGAASQRIR